MYKPNAQCKDCPERHSLCHSHCEKYLSFRKALDEWNKQEQLRKALEYDEYDYNYNIKHKNRRRR